MTQEELDQENKELKKTVANLEKQYSYLEKQCIDLNERCDLLSDENQSYNDEFKHLASIIPSQRGIVVIVVIGILLFILCLILLIFNFPNTYGLKFDYNGFLVTILGILVAVLITWQIIETIKFSDKYNHIIYSNKEIEKKCFKKYESLQQNYLKDKDSFQEIKNTVKNLNIQSLDDSITYISLYNLSDTYYDLYKVNNQNFFLSKCIKLKFETLSISYRLNQFQLCNNIIQKILEIVPDFTKIRCIQQTIDIVNSFENVEQISNYNEFKEKLGLITIVGREEDI